MHLIAQLVLACPETFDKASGYAEEGLMVLSTECLWVFIVKSGRFYRRLGEFAIKFILIIQEMDFKAPFRL